MGGMNDAIINKAPLVMSGYMVDFVLLNTFCAVSYTHLTLPTKA